MEVESSRKPDPLSDPTKKKPAPRRWFRFSVLNPTTAILRGSFAMTDKHFKFGSRGQQAVPCSVIAIVFGRLFHPKEWTSVFVDQVLEHGDKLFRISQSRNRVKPGVYLSTKFIHPEFFIGDYKCSIYIEDSILGNLFSDSVGCPGLAEGLQRFFKTNDAGVLTAQGNSVALWKYLDKGFLYFDPAPCEEFGARSSDGVACVIRFKCLNELRDLFLNNLNRKYDSRYCIDKITVLRIKLIDRGAPIMEKNLPTIDKNVLRSINPIDIDEKMIDCTQMIPKNAKKPQFAKIIKEPLKISISNYEIDKKFATEPLVDQSSFDTGYPYYDMEVNIPSTFSELPGDVLILHGWTHELSDIYKGKGAQNVSNCIAAFSMKKLHAVKTWLRPKLDEILALGDNLYAEVKAKNPATQSLTAADFNNCRVIIDGKKLFTDIDLITIVGTLSSKIWPILNLKQGLEEFFLVNKDGIVETPSMAVAVWTLDDYFYVFDPKQCDAAGTRIVEEKGSAKGARGKKKDPGSLMIKKVEGKCCVMRFPNIDDLSAHILKNVYPTRKNDRFTIRHVSVMEDIPGTRPWNEFQPGEIGKTWVLRGNIANDSEEFDDESSGVQGIAMPITALIKATEVAPNKWTSDVVDEVVREGNDYYNWCIPADEDEERELTLRNLKKYLYIKNRRVKIDLEESSVSGNLKATNGLLPNLAGGLKKFFEAHQYGIVELRDLSVAVWKTEATKEKPVKGAAKDSVDEVGYYYFDPNPRGKLGQKDPDDEDEEPVACVVRALNLDDLAARIEANTEEEVEEAEEGADEFVIHGFKIDSISEEMSNEELEIDKLTPVKPDLNNYSEIEEDGARLIGSFNQSSAAQFKFRTRDKQQAANALVALAMSKLYNPHLWYREVVDDILKLGDKITTENLENLPEEEEEEAGAGGNLPKRDYLLPSEIEDGFDIGVNRLTIDIEEGGSSGPIENLENNLQEFFKTNQMAILRQDDLILPIWKEGDIFFTLNSRGLERDSEMNQVDGPATVYWFTKISPLISTLKKIFKAEGNFTVDAVTLENAYETRIAEDERPKKTTSSENLWHNFPKLSDGIWKLSGNFSVNDEKFPEENRNNQSAALAVMSVIFSKVYEPKLWSTEVIDEVVITADKLHSMSAERLGENINFKVTQIIPEFFLSNRRLEVTIRDCVEAGKINEKNQVDLLTGLKNFFNKFSSGCITISGINLAIWRAKDFYYCVIPSNINSNNVNSDNKVAILRYKILQLLCDQLVNLFDAEIDYEIHAIDVVDWNKLPPWKFDPSKAVRPSNLPSLNAFKQLQGGARAILHGSIHQASDIFPENIRNRQTAANCVVALAMALIKNPVTWTRKTVDEILVIGCNVHQESSKFKNLEKLKPPDIVRVIHIGVNVLTSDIESGTIRGQVSLPPPEPEVKGKKAKKPKVAKAKGKKKGKVQRREKPPPPPPILLEEGLKKFFESNRAGILTTGRFMLALWKDQGVYFMFDPRARDNQGLENEFGKACVIWFACLAPMYDLINKNIDEQEKFGNYEICRAIIKTVIIEALPIPAGFQPFLDCLASDNPVTSMKKTITVDVETISKYNYVDEEVSVLSGNIHMRDQCFDVTSRGFQSTAIAAIAIVVSLLHVPSTWTPELINSIIKYGDILHRDSVRMTRSGPRTLSPCELLDVFVVGDFRVNIHIHRHTAAGILLLHDLAQALILFFRNNCAGILHTPNIAVGVMQHYGKFYMLDPRECDKFGSLSYDGTACVAKCENIMRLAAKFVNNCNYKAPCVYTINAMNVLSLHFFSDTKNLYSVECEK